MSGEISKIFNVHYSIDANYSKQSCIISIPENCISLVDGTLFLTLYKSTNIFRGTLSIQGLVATNIKDQVIIDSQPTIKILSSVPPGRILPTMLSISARGNCIQYTISNFPKNIKVQGLLSIRQQSYLFDIN